jgi:hypothetical protein
MIGLAQIQDALMCNLHMAENVKRLILKENAPRSVQNDPPKHMAFLRCLKSGCPRKLRVETDLPPIVKEIHSYCPWHAKDGWKEYPELYYDALGRQLDWETWLPMPPGPGKEKQ